MSGFGKNFYNITFTKNKSKGSAYQPSLSKIQSGSSTNTNDRPDSYPWRFRDKLNKGVYKTIDFYRFNTKKNTNLSNYTITLKPKNNTEKSKQIWLQVGNNWMTGQSSGKNNWKFNLSKLESKDHSSYLNPTKSNQAYPGFNGVRTFTFFEYPKNNTEDFYHGERNLVISTGPKNYEVTASKSIKASSIKDLNTLKFTKKINGAKYDVWVGGVAEKLMNQKGTPSIKFMIDENIDTKKKMLTQLIMYKPTSEPWDSDQTSAFIPDYPNPLHVVGDGGILNASTKRNQYQVNNTYNKFINSIVDLQSSFKPNKKNPFSTTIQGTTILNPPTRYMGTTQLNSYFFPIIEVDSWYGDKNTSFQKRLKKAVKAAMQGGSVMLADNKKSRAKAHAFDNQIVGGWNGASDGFEIATPHLDSGRNFFHVADDGLKLLSRNQTFIENTIHQGADGAPLSFAYGTGFGPSANINVNGLYLHRITQPYGISWGNGHDSNAGLVMDWFTYAENNKWSANNIKKQGGYGPAIFDGIYIPTMKQKWEANAMHSYGYFTAASRQTINQANGRGFLGPAPSGGKNYRAGGFTFKNTEVDINVPNLFSAQGQSDTKVGFLPNDGIFYPMNVSASEQIGGSPETFSNTATADLTRQMSTDVMQTVYIYGVDQPILLSNS